MISARLRRKTVALRRAIEVVVGLAMSDEDDPHHAGDVRERPRGQAQSGLTPAARGGTGVGSDEAAAGVQMAQGETQKQRRDSEPAAGSEASEPRVTAASLRCAQETVYMKLAGTTSMGTKMWAIDTTRSRPRARTTARCRPIRRRDHACAGRCHDRRCHVSTSSLGRRRTPCWPARAGDADRSCRRWRRG